MRSTRQACFSSLLNSQDPLYKQSNWPERDCIYYLYDELQDANLLFHQCCSDADALCDNIAASGKDKVVTFAGEVFVRKDFPLLLLFLLPLLPPSLPTLTKLEATPGDRIDLRISGRPEEPHSWSEKEAKVFLISIYDLIKNYSHKKTKVDCYFPVSHRDSGTHVLQNGNLERHKVSKIEDRAQCQLCFKYQRPGKTVDSSCTSLDITSQR